MEEVSQIQLIGCGDIGQRVALLCQQNGLKPVGWVRSKASQATCEQKGIASRCIDLDQEANRLQSGLGTAASFNIFYFAPPSPIGLEDTRLAGVLANLPANKVNKLVLISTTGVYGNCQGRWIDESEPLHPVTERAHRRVSVEQTLTRWCTKFKRPYIILRVPGIYAKERLPLKRIESGQPMVNAEQAPWTNRIHADDLAHACYLAMTSNCNNEIINICDDEPSTMTSYFKAVADFCNLPHPPEVSLSKAMQILSPAMRSYLQE